MRPENMQSPCLREVTQVCYHDCCPNPFHCFPEPQNTISNSRSTSSACRRNFAAITASSSFPNTQFTNHESLPSLQESFTQFTKAYPQYSKTNRVDQIRAQEYNNLSPSNHICLDYIGIGLFSRSQAGSSSSPPPPLPQNSDFPFFSISYKSVNLKLQLLNSSQGSELESTIKKRIMDFLNISENDYCMVFTANRSSAFKLLAESYPFQSSGKLLTVYDYKSEAVEAMINTSEKRGARVKSAEFKWPRLRIHSAKLRKMIVRKKRKKKKRGLFVFPLHSRMTGAIYSYQWMNMAQENGWHVLLDVCALGPKDMNSFGLSLFRPDFLICSFYKVLGENPTGFACLFVKKSTVSILEASTSTGIVSLVPVKNMFRLPEDSSVTDTELEQTSKCGMQEELLATSSSFSGPISTPRIHSGRFDQEDTSEIHKTEVTARQKVPENSETVECRGLDHVDSLGLMLISSRVRCLINWLINGLMKLQHPNTEDKVPLVKIYGPKIKFDRGPALAFNVYDWKGEKIEPILVQKLADRSNISLSYGLLHHIWFSDKYEEEKEKVIERRKIEEKEMGGNKKKGKVSQGITVVTAALGFLVNFNDIYRLWAFVAQFLDADFVEKERWRYTSLSQKTIEVVDGKLSQTCYLMALDSCYGCLCDNSIEEAAREKLAPFSTLSSDESYQSRDLEKVTQQVAKHVYDEKVLPTTLIPKQVGNMYTASPDAAFASLLYNKHSSLAGKRVIMFSYGSGLSATMFSLHLQDGQHPFRLSNIAAVMNVSEKLKSRIEFSPEKIVEIMKLMEHRYGANDFVTSKDSSLLSPGTYYLTEVDSMYRRYHAKRIC
ncbi:hypothetical protein F0562_026555 [Nyssa sinensis]|uniref:Hydroxymethylglutaryl-coenzyme A synthase C-terminal domain-containing protein n=1 Tax=Nyssa sinensis TaxID=561372 RepID=A0A5J5B9P9_9ASTE|nr:hypothetical protein F0562_026555 [Nyssa sinensis]